MDASHLFVLCFVFFTPIIMFLLVQSILKIPGFTHLLAGLGAGFFAVCIGSPVDVVSSIHQLYQ
jgi:hypothetical protein